MRAAPAHNAGRADFDPYQWIVERVDDAIMNLYVHAKRNAARIMRLVVAFLPLMMLLVGSCKTAQVSDAGMHIARQDRLRTALFPDMLLPMEGAHYAPAAGFVSRARDYVEDAPASLTQFTRQDIGFLFGQPTMQRRDADAQIWQYKTKSCVVDFYFYGDKGAADAGDMRVSYVDFRTRDQLFPGSLPPDGQPSLRKQSRCVQSIVNGDGFFRSRA